MRIRPPKMELRRMPPQAHTVGQLARKATVVCLTVIVVELILIIRKLK